MPAERRERAGAQRGGDHEAWLPDARRLLTEAFGTFVLTSVAAGADVAARLTGGEVSPLARAVAPGLVVMAMIYALGDVSGAHFNPAVTLGFTIRRLFPVPWLVAYWIAQLAGALVAGVALVGIFPADAAAGVSRPHVAGPVALAIETFLSLALVTIILGTADRSRIVGPNAAIAVGGTIAMCGLVALPVSGASMNPARSIGPAVATGHLGDLWIFVGGAVLGSLLAVALTTALHGPTPRDDKQVEAARGEPAGNQRRK